MLGPQVVDPSLVLVGELQTTSRPTADPSATCLRAAAIAIGVLGTWGCVLFAAGCGYLPTGPDGSERARLTVTDRLRRPLAGALVAFLNGPLAGSTKATDAAGRVELTTRTAGPLTISVSKDGFYTRTATISSYQSDRLASYEPFWLEAVEAPLGLEPGNYTLTISIDLATATTWMSQAPCTGFPIELASRSYRATITEASTPQPYNRVVRADDQTLTWPVLFGFGVVGRFVGFEWDDPLTEALPEFRNLRIGGAAPTTAPGEVAGASVSIPFYGSFEYCQTKSGHNYSCWHEPAEKIIAFHSCSSDQAMMVFTKR